VSRFDEEWQEWICADCDPTMAGFEEETPYEKQFIILLPKGEDAPEFCPRCKSYLGFCEGADRLKVVNTPEERWAAAQRAKAGESD
jgi:hypothetical protein